MTLLEMCLTDTMCESVLLCFVCQVSGPKKDLHSGVYGGTVVEPMTDLIGIMGAH